MTISRQDIEAKAMEIVDIVDDTREAAKNNAMIAALVVAGVIAAAFIVGRRRGSRHKTVVEVYRI